MKSVYYLQLVPSKEKKPIKIVLLGEGGVGKTTISKSYIDNYFFTKSKQTIAVEFHSKIITHSDKDVSKLQIWDLGGQEHFKHMGVFGEFCKGADAALLCFDLTDLSSLFNLSEWLEFIIPTIPRFLIGTKSDLATDDEKNFNLAQYIQRFNCITSFKCSAKDIKSVMNIFEKVLLTIERKNSKLSNISSNSNKQLSNKLLVS
jgi:small GTP-binding protein